MRKALFLALVLTLGLVAAGPVAAPAAADHQCLIEPCTHNAKELLIWVRCEVYHFFGVSCP